MENEVKLLDHGYLGLIETWGSDERIVEAARMSTGKGFLGWGEDRWKCRACGSVWLETPVGILFSTIGPSPCVRCFDNETKEVQIGSLERNPGDEKLLRYLYENAHATPFELAGLVIEVKAPIMVFREWHRHRTQSYNEMSARYTPLPNENYIPTVERLMLNSKTNKQAGTIKGSAELTPLTAQVFREALEKMYADQEDLYQSALAGGVPKELARIHLPVGRYSRMRASANLRNWLAFLTLRCDEHAQYEIRCYANAVSDLIKERFPRTHELFVEKHELFVEKFNAR